MAGTLPLESDERRGQWIGRREGRAREITGKTERASSLIEGSAADGRISSFPLFL